MIRHLEGDLEGVTGAIDYDTPYFESNDKDDLNENTIHWKDYRTLSNTKIHLEPFQKQKILIIKKTFQFLNAM